MFYKIQPKQIQLHTFSSPSGDFSVNQGEDTVELNLSRYLTGNFYITGELSINGYEIPVIDPSNITSGQNCFTWGGIYNTNTGQRNVIVNGNSNSIAGTGNVDLNGRSSSFHSSSSENTLLAGYGASFNSGTNGAAIIKDSNGYSISDKGSQTFVISFQSGTFFENGKVVFDDVGIYLSDAGSGIFSGDCNFLGDLTKSGIALATTGDLGVASGVLNSKINTTSGVLSSEISSATGALFDRIYTGIDTLSGNSVLVDTDQYIFGEKIFYRNSIFNQSLYLKGDSGAYNGADSCSAIVPSNSGDSVGSRGLIAWSGSNLYLKICDSPHIWNRFTGSINWP